MNIKFTFLLSGFLLACLWFTPSASAYEILKSENFQILNQPERSAASDTSAPQDTMQPNEGATNSGSGGGGSSGGGGGIRSISGAENTDATRNNELPGRKPIPPDIDEIQKQLMQIFDPEEMPSIILHENGTPLPTNDTGEGVEYIYVYFDECEYYPCWMLKFYRLIKPYYENIVVVLNYSV